MLNTSTAFVTKNERRALAHLLMGILIELNLPKAMAINPYEPELAKRKKVLEIATTQLSQEMNKLRHQAVEGYRKQMEQVDEALKDYRQARAISF